MLRGYEGTLAPLKEIFPEDDLKRLARKLLIEGRISGEEYLNLISNHPMKIMGIEDIHLYAKSLKSYADLAGGREITLQYLGTIQNAVGKLKKKFYSQELLDYERIKWGQETSGKEQGNFEESFRKLVELARHPEANAEACLPARQGSQNRDSSSSPAAIPQNDGLSNYPNLKQLKLLQDKEKLIDFNLANLEQAALVEETDPSTRNSLRSLLARDGQTNINKLSLFGRFQKLFNIAHGKNINLNQYPNLLKYEEYLKEFTNINLEQALNEIEKLEDQVYKTYLSGQEQNRHPEANAEACLPARQGSQNRDSSKPLTSQNDGLLLRAIDRYLKLLDTAYRIQMTTKDFKMFEVNEPDFSTVSYQAFINRKLAEQGFFEDLIPYKNILEEGKKALVDFYDSVDKRDLAFIKNTDVILRSEATKNLRTRSLPCRQAGFVVPGVNKGTPQDDGESPKVAVMITGGYHTQHLTELFKDKGYSYIVLTPNVTQETNQSKYEKLLLSPLKPETKTIQTVQGEEKTDRSLSALEKDLVLLKKKDGVKPLEAVDSLVDLPSFLKVSPAAYRQNRIEALHQAALLERLKVFLVIRFVAKAHRTQWKVRIGARAATVSPATLKPRAEKSQTSLAATTATGSRAATSINEIRKVPWKFNPANSKYVPDTLLLTEAYQKQKTLKETHDTYTAAKHAIDLISNWMETQEIGRRTLQKMKIVRVATPRSSYALSTNAEHWLHLSTSENGEAALASYETIGHETTHSQVHETGLRTALKINRGINEAYAFLGETIVKEVSGQKWRENVAAEAVIGKAWLEFQATIKPEDTVIPSQETITAFMRFVGRRSHDLASDFAALIRKTSNDAHYGFDHYVGYYILEEILKENDGDLKKTAKKMGYALKNQESFNFLNPEAFIDSLRMDAWKKLQENKIFQVLTKNIMGLLSESISAFASKYISKIVEKRINKKVKKDLETDLLASIHENSENGELANRGSEEFGEMIDNYLLAEKVIQGLNEEARPRIFLEPGEDTLSRIIHSEIMFTKIINDTALRSKISSYFDYKKFISLNYFPQSLIQTLWDEFIRNIKYYFAKSEVAVRIYLSNYILSQVDAGLDDKEKIAIRQFYGVNLRISPSFAGLFRILKNWKLEKARREYYILRPNVFHNTRLRYDEYLHPHKAKELKGSSPKLRAFQDLNLKEVRAAIQNYRLSQRKGLLISLITQTMRFYQNKNLNTQNLQTIQNRLKNNFLSFKEVDYTEQALINEITHLEVNERPSFVLEVLSRERSQNDSPFKIQPVATFIHLGARMAEYTKGTRIVFEGKPGVIENRQVEFVEIRFDNYLPHKTFRYVLNAIVQSGQLGLEQKNITAAPKNLDEAAIHQKLIQLAQSAIQDSVDGNEYGFSEKSGSALKLFDQLTKDKKKTWSQKEWEEGFKPEDYVEFFHKYPEVYFWLVFAFPTSMGDEKILGKKEANRTKPVDIGPQAINVLEKASSDRDDLLKFIFYLVEFISEYKKWMGRPNYKALQYGSTLVVSPFKNLAQLSDLQKKIGSFELGFVVLKEGKRNHILLSKGTHYNGDLKFPQLASALGHTHYSGNPNPSPQDTLIASYMETLGIPSFVLSFEKDGKVNVAVYQPEEANWKLIKDQEEVARILVGYGLLAGARLVEPSQARLADTFAMPDHAQLASPENLSSSDRLLAATAIVSRHLKTQEQYSIHFQNGFALVESQAPNTAVFYKYNETKNHAEAKKTLSNLRQGLLNRALSSKSVDDVLVRSAAQDFSSLNRSLNDALKNTIHGLSASTALDLFVGIEGQDIEQLADQAASLVNLLNASNESSADAAKLHVSVQFVDNNNQIKRVFQTSGYSEFMKDQGSRLSMAVGTMDWLPFSFLSLRSNGSGVLPIESSLRSGGMMKVLAPVLKVAVLMKLLDPQSVKLRRILKTLTSHDIEPDVIRSAQKISTDTSAETFIAYLKTKDFLIKIRAILAESLAQAFMSLTSAGSAA